MIPPEVKYQDPPELQTDKVLALRAIDRILSCTDAEERAIYTIAGARAAQASEDGMISEEKALRIMRHLQGLIVNVTIFRWMVEGRIGLDYDEESEDLVWVGIGLKKGGA